MSWWLSHGAAFLAGLAAVPASKLAAEAGYELHSMWTDTEYYEHPDNLENLNVVGKIVLRVMRAVKGRRR